MNLFSTKTTTIFGAAVLALSLIGCGVIDGNETNHSSSASIEGSSSSSGGGGYSSVGAEEGPNIGACIDADVKIGNQTWKKCNLNVMPSGDNGAATFSWCYFDKEEYCDAYGRLYDWATAMALPENCGKNSCADKINTPHQGLCPDGYHIPSNDDWKELFLFVDDAKGVNDGNALGLLMWTEATQHLKATEGWENCGTAARDVYECLDTYGFSALPGGHTPFSTDEVEFYHAEMYGYWWSADEKYNTLQENTKIKEAYNAYIPGTASPIMMGGAIKFDGFSVRCIKDN
ncbi:MAG: hypothetical protein LBR60_05705 [Fibrobacter sp.]|jgi:uncharacterized protein (TIGR02145 family)|nr:hypothetical protein [Fibrobacter sp.]